MIPQKLIDRINILARKEKTEGLNLKEKEEQKKLRIQYLELFREGFDQRLSNLKIIDQDSKVINPKKKKKVN